MKRLFAAAAALILVAGSAHATGYVGLVQADGVTPVGAASPLRIQIGDAAGLGVPTVVGVADGAATSGGNISLPVKAYLNAYNGTTTDTVRGNTTGLAVITGGLPANHWSYPAAASGIVNTTTAVTIKASAGAGLRNCISDIEIDHDTLGAVTEIVINDGAAGTALWRGKLQTTAAEGRSINLGSAVCGTAATLLEVKIVTAVTGGVYVNVQGYISP